METREESQKKPKHRSRAGLVFLIILLLLIGSVGFVCYSVFKAPVVLDNPQQMAAMEPISAEERFRFSSAEGTVQMKVCPADIWNLVVTYAGTDFLDMVNQELSSYSVSVSGCGIHIDEKGLRLDLEVFYEDIRLAAKVPCTLEVSGQHFCFKPAGVKLGVLPLPVEDLLSSAELEFDFPIPVITDMTGVSYEEGAILLTGTMEEDIRSIIPPQTLYRLAILSEPMQPLTDALLTNEGYAAMLSYLEKNPGDIETLYQHLFALAGPESTKKYLDRYMGLTQRVFPGIDYAVSDTLQAELLEPIEPLLAILERFFPSVVSDYNGKVFRFSEGEFLKKLKPFHATNYGTGSYDELFAVLNPDDFFLVLVDVEDGFTRKTPPLSKLADENQQFTQPVDYEKIYILGCVFRSMDGDPFLLYESEIQENCVLTLHPLTEKEVSALKVDGKFGVWTG